MKAIDCCTHIFCIILWDAFKPVVQWLPNRQCLSQEIECGQCPLDILQNATVTLSSVQCQWQGGGSQKRRQEKYKSPLTRKVHRLSWQEKHNSPSTRKDHRLSHRLYAYNIGYMVVKGELHLKSWDRRGARKGTLLIYETRIVWDGLHLPHSPKTRDSLERVESWKPVKASGWQKVVGQCAGQPVCQCSGQPAMPKTGFHTFINLPATMVCTKCQEVHHAPCRTFGLSVFKSWSQAPHWSAMVHHWFKDPSLKSLPHRWTVSL